MEIKKIEKVMAKKENEAYLPQQRHQNMKH